MKPVSGIILAGGKSARMGIDKADLVLSGRTFLEIQTEKMKTVGVTDIMVSGWWRPLPDVRYVEDMSAGVGPLGGLQACFAAAACEDCLVLSVDVPLIPVSVLTSLLEAHFTGSKAVTLLSGERGSWRAANAPCGRCSTGPAGKPCLIGETLRCSSTATPRRTMKPSAVWQVKWDNSRFVGLSYACSEFPGGLRLIRAEDHSQILPAQPRFEAGIPGDGLAIVCTTGGHEEDALLWIRILPRVADKGVQSVHGCFQRAADSPPVDGGGEHDYLSFPEGTVDLIHIIPLDTG